MVDLHRVRRAVSMVALGLLAAACGGGGGGSTPAEPALASALSVACSGDFCGASSNTQYSGQGVGIWSYTNTTGGEASIPVALQNLGTRSVTLVYTNPNAPAVRMPPFTLDAAASASLRSEAGDGIDRTNHIPDGIRSFDAPAHLKPAAPGTQAKAAAALAALGSTRSWYINPGNDNTMVSRSATLRRQARAADGRTINLWLENTEFGDSKVTDVMLDTLMDRFARPTDSVYGLVVGLADEPWGPHNYSNLIGPDQPIDIVLVNFVPDGKPYGLLGYFWALNNLVAQADDARLKYSNESLSFYMDTETLYLARTGMNDQIRTLAHEFVHMINFYQRSVRGGIAPNGGSYAFDTFLEEMSAVMVEDILSEKITPGSNPMRDNHVPAWLARSGFNCNPTDWSIGATCFGYDVVGAYGAYLLRQHGVGFYQQLLRNKSSTDSWTVLGNAIADAGGPALATSLQRWGSGGIALLPTQNSPAGYGYPRRDDGGFTLVGINGPDYAKLRQLPATVPTALAGHGHFPFTRQADGKGVYQEQLNVPQGSTLTVIVQ